MSGFVYFRRLSVLYIMIMVVGVVFRSRMIAGESQSQSKSRHASPREIWRLSRIIVIATNVSLVKHRDAAATRQMQEAMRLYSPFLHS